LSTSAVRAEGRREAPLDAWRERAWIAAAALPWAALALLLVGWLKVGRHWRTGDTRKLFHLLIFGGAALVQGRAGFGGTLAYGVAVSAAIAVVVVRGTCGPPLASPGYEALARESDAPHRTWYVVVPWFATALGGVAANLLFPQHATFGYLAVGLADAVGEPVGIRFGRHRYRVPLPAKVVATRSLEGSAAVFVASGLAGAIALRLSGAPLDGTLLEGATLLRLSLFAAACTLVEAAAPHGWDNFVLQVAASAAAMGLFPGAATHG
jgi:phytol kinase